MSKKKTVCMIVQDPMVKGGIAAVINGYRGSKLEEDYKVVYVESYKDGSKLTKFIKGVRGYIDFVRVLLVEKPSLIHIHSSFGPSFYRKIPYIYLSIWSKKNVINHIHGAEFESFYLNASNFKRRLITTVYNKCSALIALSDEWKEKLELIVPGNRIEVIENYSVIKEEALLKKRKAKRKNQVLFLGQIGERKGCYDIPDVIEKVVKQVPNVKFVLAGDGDIVKVRDNLKIKGVEKNVYFPGWVRGEDKDRLLRDSDIFFLPSYNEGMPMSILDAMGYGLPIVSTNVGGIPKIVQNNENGHTFEPGDTDGFANAIVNILEDHQIMQTFGINSYDVVKNKYSLDTHIERLSTLYNSF